MIKGFILAAGFSKRLRPITEYIPKPLIPLAGEILLDYVYNFLKASGVNHIGINLHYKKEEIEQHIKEKNLPLKLFYEEEILNTGGALYNAKDFLSESVFVVHNSDIYWDGNLKAALTYHKDSKNSITLLVHNYLPDNKLIVDRESNFIDIIPSSSGNQHALAFIGVAIYSPEVLELLPKGPSSVIELWLKAKTKGLKVKAFSVEYNFWYDIGTPISYARAVFNKLKRNFTSLFVHPTSTGCELIDIKGNIVIERNVEIKTTFKGKNIIILPEVTVSLKVDGINPSISDCIIGENFLLPISNWQDEEESLPHGGSMRRYYRKNNKVFCKWEEVEEDFKKTLIIGKFFRQKGFPVPDIFNGIKDKTLILFEDLGDLTLYSWLKCKRKENEILDIYKQIIENIAKLHWEISSHISELKISLPEFDYEYFRWESNYFLKECVEGFFNVDLSITYGKSFTSNLNKEFHLIADKLSKTKKVILHRDLQSQNIMLKNGMVYFIDYQSARLGPVGYDLASLLWDPYVNLNDEIRQELVNFYINKSLTFQALVIDFQADAFAEELSICRIQRHMQALGAYGFLFMKREKKNFLKFIPSALELLIKDINECVLEFKALKELAFQLKNLVKNSF